MSETSIGLFGKGYELLERGASLTETRAAELEKRLKTSPTKINYRLQLIGFYRRKLEYQKLRAEHLLWMIDNCPHNQAWKHRVLMGFTQNNTPDEVAFAKEAWLKKVKTSPLDSDIVGNAGIFLIESEFALGKELLAKACDLAPEDDFWPSELGEFCFWQAQANDSNRLQNFEAALEFGERFLKLYGSEGGRCHSAIRWRAHLRCANSALELGKLDQAKRHAALAIESSAGGLSVPKTGLSILGLVALKEGAVEEAEHSLLELDQKYVVDSTDLKLANELVKIGHSAVVSLYLSKCKSRGLWANRPVDSWLNDLEHNLKPIIY